MALSDVVEFLHSLFTGGKKPKAINLAKINPNNFCGSEGYIVEPCNFANGVVLPQQTSGKNNVTKTNDVVDAIKLAKAMSLEKCDFAKIYFAKGYDIKSNSNFNGLIYEFFQDRLLINNDRRAISKIPDLEKRDLRLKVLENEAKSNNLHENKKGKRNKNESLVSGKFENGFYLRRFITDDSTPERNEQGEIENLFYKKANEAIVKAKKLSKSAVCVCIYFAEGFEKDNPNQSDDLLVYRFEQGRCVFDLLNTNISKENQDVLNSFIKDVVRTYVNVIKKEKIIKYTKLIEKYESLFKKGLLNEAEFNSYKEKYTNYMNI